MKLTTTAFIALSGIMLLSFNSNSQIKIKKPKLSVKTPKVKTPEREDLGIGKKDPSGLFTNCSDDPSADSHRRNAVENLEKLEAEYAKSSVDYDVVSKLIFNNERSLGYVVKLEPKVKSELYYARYTPIKEKADKQLPIYEKAQNLESVFRQ